MGDRVFIRIAFFKHMMRFRRKGKLAHTYISLYEIMERIGKVAYKFALSASMNRIIDVFHLSSLHKCINDPLHMLRTNEIQLLEDLSHDEKPNQILDRRIKQLRN